MWTCMDCGTSFSEWDQVWYQCRPHVKWPGYVPNAELDKMIAWSTKKKVEPRRELPVHLL